MKIKTIALVLPSGCIKEEQKKEINSKIDFLKSKFNVKKYYNENSSDNYLSDTDENRARYFEQAFSDNEVDLVLSVRGGYGAIRIVDKINYNLLKDKYYVGSSDATILLSALYKKTNVKCFHGLMVSNGFVENLDKNIEIIEKNLFNLKPEPIQKGSCKGILWGGNLSSLVSTFSGEQYIPDKDIILFLEDLNEPKYKIDKMLFEIYRNKNLKSKIKGIIFGDFYFEKKEIIPLIKEFSELFNVPSFYTNDITHKQNNVLIPYGKLISL